ncbi:calpain-6, partial [Brachionus plicatilis]
MYPNYPNQRSPSSQSLYPNSGSIGFNDPMNSAPMYLNQSDYPPQSSFPVYQSGEPGFPFEKTFPNPASIGLNNSMYPNQSGNPPQSGFPMYTDYSGNSSLPPPLSSYPGQQSYQNFPTFNSSHHNQQGIHSFQPSSISSYSNQSGYPSNEPHSNLGYLPTHIAANPSFQPTQFYGGSPDIYNNYGSKNLHQNQSVQNHDLYQSFNPSDDAHTLYRAMKDLRTSDTALNNLEVIRPFKDQVFEELKFQHDEFNLFEDPLFPASSRSLFFTQMPPQGVMWLRPKEVNPDAEFVTAGFGRCDMDQGYLGNCWFI